MWSATLLDSFDLAILEFLAAHRSPALTAIPMMLGVLGTAAVPMGLLVLIAMGIAL